MYSDTSAGKRIPLPNSTKARAAASPAAPRDAGRDPDLAAYLRQIRGTPLLSAHEERWLGWRSRNDGDSTARDHMVLANLRLVVAIARDFMGRGLTLTELIADGNIGLIRAVERFDPAQGTRFSTYGAWWIRQAMALALIKDKQPVHVPAYMVELVGRCARTERELALELDRAPDDAELARAMEVAPAKLARVRRVMNAFSASRSLTGVEGGAEPPVRENVSVDPPEERIDRTDTVRTVRQLLDTVDPRDARVVRLRFGMEGREAMTLSQIGRELGLTRERVRQIVQAVLDRLRRELSGGRRREPALSGRPSWQ